MPQQILAETQIDGTHVCQTLLKGPTKDFKIVSPGVQKHLNCLVQFLVIVVLQTLHPQDVLQPESSWHS